MVVSAPASKLNKLCCIYIALPTFGSLFPGEEPAWTDLIVDLLLYLMSFYESIYPAQDHPHLRGSDTSMVAPK